MMCAYSLIFESPSTLVEVFSSKIDLFGSFRKSKLINLIFKKMSMDEWYKYKNVLQFVL